MFCFMEIARSAFKFGLGISQHSRIVELDGAPELFRIERFRFRGLIIGGGAPVARFEHFRIGKYEKLGPLLTDAPNPMRQSVSNALHAIDNGHHRAENIVLIGIHDALCRGIQSPTLERLSWQDRKHGVSGYRIAAHSKTRRYGCIV